jgi:hypothetical protein
LQFGRDVVEHDREIDVFCDGAEVQKEAFLSRFIIVGGDHQSPISAGMSSGFGESNGFGGAVGPGAGHDFDSSGRMFAGDSNDPLVFIVSQRGTFAGGADRNNTVGAGCNVEIDQFAEHGFVERAVRGHWSDEGHGETGEFFAASDHDELTFR